MMLSSPAFIGLVMGLLCLIPGFGVAHVIIFTTSYPTALPYAICSSLMINSIKEATCPQISGNIVRMSVDEPQLKIDSFDRFKKIINNKLICWGLGIVVGLIMPEYMLPRELIIIIILGLMVQVNLKELPSLLLWLGLVGTIYITEKDTSNLVLLVSLLVYNIPAILNLKKQKTRVVKMPDVIIPNYALLLIGSFLTLMAPGLSASTIFSRLNTNHSSTELSATLADTVIESAGLTLLLKNVTNGKSLIGDLLPVINIELFISCLGIICISYCLTLSLSNFFIKFYEENENYLIIVSTILSCISIIKLSDYGLILIILSLIVNIIISKLKVTNNIKGFTFCVPLLIG